MIVTYFYLRLFFYVPFSQENCDLHPDSIFALSPAFHSTALVIFPYGPVFYQNNSQ